MKGQVSGFSKASKARLRSNSLRTAGFSARRREKGEGGVPTVDKRPVRIQWDADRVEVRKKKEEKEKEKIEMEKTKTGNKKGKQRKRGEKERERKRPDKHRLTNK